MGLSPSLAWMTGEGPANKVGTEGKHSGQQTRGESYCVIRAAPELGRARGKGRLQDDAVGPQGGP